MKLKLIKDKIVNLNCTKIDNMTKELRQMNDQELIFIYWNLEQIILERKRKNG